MEERCENCRCGHLGVGFINPPLTCASWPGAEGRWRIVERQSRCRNFKPKRQKEPEHDWLERASEPWDDIL